MLKPEYEWALIPLKKGFAHRLLTFQIFGLFYGVIATAFAIFKEFKGIDINLHFFLYSLLIYGIITVSFLLILILEQKIVNAVMIKDLTGR